MNNLGLIDGLMSGDDGGKSKPKYPDYDQFGPLDSLKPIGLVMAKLVKKLGDKNGK